MKQRQGGFTLIELVMVIVILGVLSAVAIPKFVDLSTEARAAALKGVVGGLNSASAINVAGCAVNGNTLGTNKCIPLTTSNTCSEINSKLMNTPVTISVVADLTGTLVAGTYYITTATNLALSTGGTACTLYMGTGPATTISEPFTGYSTS